ncbi:MAG: sigma-70 family RNA polymerase sigma factor [Bacilli bacterium]|nr:sigma-70 family RNA polymerase sigma factor [Bacilli bacterium]
MLTMKEKYIKETIEKYSNMIYRICLMYLKNNLDAEDAYQEIFIKIMEKSPIFVNENHQKAWIITVTTNHCKNILKKRTYYKTITYDDNINIPINDKEDKEILSIIFTLPLNYRNVIYLYYYEGYSTKEIAKILHKRESTIRTWLKRARESLKILIGGVFDE